MRCPDCSKFVSMENGDLEVNSLDVNREGTTFTVTANMRGTRNCADCSTELKECNMDAEEAFELAEMTGWENLNEAQQAILLAAVEGDDTRVEVDVDEESTSVEEGGGGRYAKNMITSIIDYKVRLSFKADGQEMPWELHKEGQLSSEHAAGEYEECC